MTELFRHMKVVGDGDGVVTVARAVVEHGRIYLAVTMDGPGRGMRQEFPLSITQIIEFYNSLVSVIRLADIPVMPEICNVRLRRQSDPGA